MRKQSVRRRAATHLQTEREKNVVIFKPTVTINYITVRNIVSAGHERNGRTESFRLFIYFFTLTIRIVLFSSFITICNVYHSVLLVL